MVKIRKKKFIEMNVYDKAKERVNYIYDNYDNVSVSFSAGKDSTAVLNVALEVAKERGKLPLRVMFFDEEAIHPPTIEYALRVAKNKDINFEWYCLEFKHRNACSSIEPYWYCWDRDKENVWVRDLPEGVNLIREHKHFKKGMSFQEFSPYLGYLEKGSSIVMTGVRSEESLRRFRMMAMKKNDNYIAGTIGTLAKGHPIYDWSSNDVWYAVTKFGWDYNKTYDIFNKTKLYNKFLTQRVCPPFGEEPLRGLWVYAQCFPDMWHKMLNRVDGVGSAWRYANTNLYGFGKSKKPENVTYMKYISVILDSYSSKMKNDIKKNLNEIVRSHTRVTDDKIPETEPHPLSGLSMEFLVKIALKGDAKGRTQGTLTGLKHKAQNDLGITQQEAKLRYGRR